MLELDDKIISDMRVFMVVDKTLCSTEKYSIVKALQRKNKHVYR